MADLEDLTSAIIDALDENKAIDVVAALSGALVVLLEDEAKRAGHDPNNTIVLNSGEHSRKIVIHALGEDN